MAYLWTNMDVTIRDLDIRVIKEVDRELYLKENVITSDSVILDYCVSWINLIEGYMDLPETNGYDNNYDEETILMYYVPDGTKRCGFYECEECRQRFLDVRIVPRIACPYCGEDQDMEIGPDDEIPEVKETARLIQMIQGEDVEKYDALLSLAITGGDYSWI